MAIVNRGWAFVSGSDATAASGGDKDIQFNNVGFLSGNILLTYRLLFMYQHQLFMAMVLI